MPKVDENKSIAIASLLKGLSLLENDVFLLYKALSEKVDLPLPKSLLLTIAIDSQKHGTVLKGLGESIAKSKASPKEYEEKLSPIWNVIENYHKEVTSKQRISAEELPKLLEKLRVLEGELGEEYYVFTQMKTLEFMTKAINNLYKIDLKSVGNIFADIIDEEGKHNELLRVIIEFLEKTQLEKTANPLL